MAELIQGWEPDLEVGDTILRRFIAAYADRTAAMATALGGQTARDADAAYADPASAFLYDNAVVLLRPPTADSMVDVVRRAYAFYPSQRAWALLSVFPLGDLTSMGLTRDSHPPLMLRLPGPAQESTPDGLRIARVRTAEQLADFDRVLVNGYPGIEPGGSVANPSLVEQVVNLFVGYLDGEPVATAGSAVNHGLVEVDWVCTLPEHRGRGLGRALTSAATMVEPTLPAVLIASDYGRGVYEKLGYVSVMRATLWTRLPEWSRPL